MKTNISEYQLYDDIEKFLVRRGYKTSQEIRPHPSSTRCVDIVGIKPRLRKVVVVEAKLSDYSRVLKQGMAGLFISDFVYISVPYDYAQTVLRKHTIELCELGIGVIGVNGKAIELLAPKQSQLVESKRKDRLIEMVMRGGKKSD